MYRIKYPAFADAYERMVIDGEAQEFLEEKFIEQFSEDEEERKLFFSEYVYNNIQQIISLNLTPKSVLEILEENWEFECKERAISAVMRGEIPRSLDDDDDDF